MGLSQYRNAWMNSKTKSYLEEYSREVEKTLQAIFMANIKLLRMESYEYISREEYDRLSKILDNEVELGIELINNLYKEYEQKQNENKNKEDQQN